ncbi:MAG TPA: helix-turn-helix domain-containing protein [Lacipirellulaceae bacterium]|nr:helix-turn-helix domain-containing protein [Lacipirellulaceae bacterium]
MTKKKATIDSLSRLFDESRRPMYAIDSQRRIAYCNRALAMWLDMTASRIVGRLVEYHSEPSAQGDEAQEAAPLTDLCPPPRALAGEPCTGTLSCMARDGRLVHRQAEFIPLTPRQASRINRNAESVDSKPSAVLAMLAESDTSTQELANELSGEPSADELHRTIRRFRRGQVGRYSVESLLGNGPAIQKVRAQVAASGCCGANVIVCGPPGTGRGHVARAIHYYAAGETVAKLVSIDCQLLTDDLLRRTLDRLRTPRDEPTQRPTLLLENLDWISPSQQLLLAAAICDASLNARIVATLALSAGGAAEKVNELAADGAASGNGDGRAEEASLSVDSAMLHAISTITIQVPPLTERMEDLPVLAQFFLESCNQGVAKQVGSLRADALDLLALYCWPGELDQLREVITAAHRACNSHEITPADLPAIIHHASLAAARRLRPQPERIVLDDLLANIEKEAIVRALSQARGNKSEAANLLGMTRPRLYRRLVQLGLVAEGVDEPPPEEPEFVEQDPSE